MFIVFSALRSWTLFMSLVMGLAATGTLVDITRSMMQGAAHAQEIGFMSMGAFNRMLLSGGKSMASPPRTRPASPNVRSLARASGRPNRLHAPKAKHDFPHSP